MNGGVPIMKENLEKTSTKTVSKLNLTETNSTFFSLTNNDESDKQKIDNAKKTLDSIYETIIRAIILL